MKYGDIHVYVIIHVSFQLKKKDEDNCRMYVLLRVWID